MKQKNLEYTSLRDRFKELKGLYLFIICATFVSIIVMNLLVLPISYFAVHNKEAFTLVVKCLILLALASYIFFRIRRRIILSRKEGIPFIKAIFTSFITRFSRIYISIIKYTIAALLILLIYYLISSNYTILNIFLK